MPKVVLLTAWALERYYVWFDEFDVHPGESLRDGLEGGLRGNDVFLALLDLGYPGSQVSFLSSGRRLE